eukprot:m.16104 g.16104  ORF g.16104 m.16104 type:complete len:452 (-) comp5161_c0_seq2:26-1381(-)
MVPYLKEQNHQGSWSVRSRVTGNRRRAVLKGRRHTAAMLVAVHSGCGQHSREGVQRHREACRQACRQAMAVLLSNATAVDAVAAALRCFEEDDVSNCGRGSNLTLDGQVQCDASVMDDAGHYGAVAAAEGVVHPSTVALTLLRGDAGGLLPLGRIPPLVLGSNGARVFAREHNLDTFDPNSADNPLKTERQGRAHQRWMARLVEAGATGGGSTTSGVTKPSAANTGPTTRGAKRKRHLSGSASAPLDGHNTAWDTVGAVCVDATGNIASGVSSGGIAVKRSGRVGQAASFGAGCWACRKNGRAVGTCTTGNGESLIKSLLAMRTAEDMAETDDDDLAGPDRLRASFERRFLNCQQLSKEQAHVGGVLAVRTQTTQNHRRVEIGAIHGAPSLVFGCQVAHFKPGKGWHAAPPSADHVRATSSPWSLDYRSVQLQVKPQVDHDPASTAAAASP